MKVLDLFSGIGGFSLGLERAGMRTVAFCEIDPFCRQVLRKHWPDVPIFEDVRTLHGSDVGDVDLICGGYPCQPFSYAGKRGGDTDPRHLWPEVRRLIEECRPAWFLGENVAGHVTMGLDDVLDDLASSSYSARAFVIPASALGAWHTRERVFVVAHADSVGCEALSIKTSEPNEACSFAEWQQVEFRGARGGFVRPVPTSRVCGMADGLPEGLDRLRALGNSIVPQIPEMIGRAIMGAA